MDARSGVCVYVCMCVCRRRRGEGHGRIADLLLNAVRSELKNKMIGGENFSRESVSPMKLLAKPGHKLPFNVVEEVLVTVEDVQNSVMNGL